MQIVCCVCQRHKKNGVWVGSSSSVGEQRVSHGYCPSCYIKIMRRCGLPPLLPSVLHEEKFRHGATER